MLSFNRVVESVSNVPASHPLTVDHALHGSFIVQRTHTLAIKWNFDPSLSKGRKILRGTFRVLALVVVAIKRRQP